MGGQYEDGAPPTAGSLSLSLPDPGVAYGPRRQAPGEALPLLPPADFFRMREAGDYPTGVGVPPRNLREHSEEVVEALVPVEILVARPHEEDLARARASIDLQPTDLAFLQAVRDQDPSGVREKVGHPLIPGPGQDRDPGGPRKNPADPSADRSRACPVKRFEHPAMHLKDHRHP